MQDMNQCSQCHEHYCDGCVEKIDKCQKARLLKCAFYRDCVE